MPAEQNIEFCVRQFYDRYKRDVSLFPQGRGTGQGGIDSALSVSSKTGTGGRGAPDFVGVFPSAAATIFVVECKANVSMHKSRELAGAGAYIGNDKIKGKSVAACACDGALHYGKILSPHYNIVALGVSGDKDGNIAAADYYYQIKGGKIAASDQRVNGIKENLLKKNTLEGVFKMSKITFQGVVNVETIIIVFTAGVPHGENHKVYFGNWEDDEMHFERNIGAVDKFGGHDAKISSFVRNFHERKSVDGESILAAAAPDEEWLYQAKLTGHVREKLWETHPDKSGVARHILNYFAAQARLGDVFVLTDALKECSRAAAPDAPNYWREFRLDEVFALSKGKRFSENQVNIRFKEYPAPGYIPYVSSSDIEEKQGLNGYISVSLVGKPTHNGAYMTLNYGGGMLNCFYREGPAYCTDSLNVAKLRDGTPMNVYVAAYLKEMLVQYKPCFSYNLQPSLARIRPLKIPLPMTAKDAVDWPYLADYARRTFYANFGNKKPRAVKS